MSPRDMCIESIYTDQHGRFRKIVQFYDGFDLERRIKYERGYLIGGEHWRAFHEPSGDCTKETFARWAKERVKRGRVGVVS